MKKVQLPKVKTENTSWRLETSISSSREEEGSQDNHRMTKRRSKKVKTTRTEKVIGSALDVVIQIILSENVQNHHRTRIKELSSEVLGVIAVRKMMKRLKTKRVSWLTHLARDKSGLGINSFEAIISGTKETKFMKSQNETSYGGSPLTVDGGPQNVPMAPKANQGPPELVRNLPKLKFDQHFCNACKIGEQAHASHKAKNIVSRTRCLELLHMDLFGPTAVRSDGGNLYTLVIVDDYSWYTWTRFLKNKTEAFE
ncbi:retrovirus-related pol polyprotein from transposon TNT 1-94 [Tanacetum coccineum]